MIKDSPGNTKLIEMKIHTGDSKHFQSVPYLVPVTLVQPMKDALDILVSANIIEPSYSPWSSSMIPVKRMGQCRYALTFADLTQLQCQTAPDPYLMPCIDTIIDGMANASFLFKFDLVGVSSSSSA